MKTVKIQTKSNIFYRQVLTLLNLIFNWRLTTTEIKILAQLLYHYNKFLEAGEADRGAEALTFDYDTKADIREELDKMSVDNFNNYMSKLRQKGLINSRGIEPIAKIIKNKYNKLLIKFEDAPTTTTDNKEDSK